MSKVIVMDRTFQMMSQEHQAEMGINIIGADVFGEEVYFELGEEN